MCQSDVIGPLTTNVTVKNRGALLKLDTQKKRNTRLSQPSLNDDQQSNTDIF